MVPRAVASLVSYEAERRMMRAPSPRSPVTQEDWKKQRGLLRFGVSEGRLTGLPLLLLVYPCLTFARDCDPRELARDAHLTAAEVRARFATRIRALIDRLDIVSEPGKSTDDRWYWLAPMLLDYTSFPVESQAWWDRADLARMWAGVEVGEEDAGWSNHVERAKHTLAVIHRGEEHLSAHPGDLFNNEEGLGLMPDDLFDVLALAASAAPATVALRAYARASRSDPALSLSLRDIAARTGRAFLTLFNHAEVIEAVRAEYPVSHTGSVCGTTHTVVGFKLCLTNIPICFVNRLALRRCQLMCQRGRLATSSSLPSQYAPLPLVSMTSRHLATPGK